LGSSRPSPWALHSSPPQRSRNADSSTIARRGHAGSRRAPSAARNAPCASFSGVADAPNFSTGVIFAQEEMTVETLRDQNNRRTQGRVVENVGAYVVAPASGVLFYNALT
jgi:hypothetical protein